MDVRARVINMHGVVVAIHACIRASIPWSQVLVCAHRVACVRACVRACVVDLESRAGADDADAVGGARDGGVRPHGSVLGSHARGVLSHAAIRRFASE